MSLLSILLSFFLAGARPCKAQESRSDILKTGSFEEAGVGDMPLGWSVIPTSREKGEAFREESDAHSGKSCLVLKPNDKNSGDGFGVYTTLDPQAIQGRTVTISGYARANGLGDSPAAILFKTDAKNWVVVPSADSDHYTRFEKTFKVSGSIPEAAVLILVGGSHGSIRIDDLTIGVDVFGQPENLRVKETAPAVGETDANKINTAGWQDSPFISPDGQELYFAYVPYTQIDLRRIAAGKISESDVAVRGPIRPGSHGTLLMETYKSVKQKDSGWGKPVNLNINGVFPLYAAKLSPDGKQLVYVIRDGIGGYGSGDIYVSSKLDDGGWSPPQNLGPPINTELNEDTPAFGVDENTLYFARNGGDALGWEIWVSHKTGGKWGEPEKMAPPINESDSANTANHQPFITGDGKEFYFTRVVHLFRSLKQADGSWGTPEQVMDRVAGHASVSADGRYLYFLTAANGEDLERHHWTIWRAERSKEGGWGDPKPVD